MNLAHASAWTQNLYLTVFGLAAWALPTKRLGTPDGDWLRADPVSFVRIAFPRCLSPFLPPKPKRVREKR